VASGEQADQQLLHHGILADDGLRNRMAQLAEAGELGLDFGFGDGVHIKPKACLKRG